MLPLLIGFNWNISVKYLKPLKVPDVLCYFFFLFLKYIYIFLVILFAPENLGTKYINIHYCVSNMVGHPFQNYDIVYVGFFAAYNRL